MTNTAQKTLSLVVIGAGTTRQGTGPWLCQFATKDNCKIEAVIGRDSASTLRAVKSLGDKFGIHPRPIAGLDELVSKPDLVVIASPASSHRAYVLDCIERSLPIFCEKPFVWDDSRDNLADTRHCVERLNTTQTPLWLNTQWNRSLHEFGLIYPNVDKGKVTKLRWEMAPGSTGATMIVDALPHATAMLLELTGVGKTADLMVTFTDECHCQMTFNWITDAATVAVEVVLETIETQPRPFAYEINGKRVERQIDMSGYHPSFKSEHGIFPIKDPLQCQIAGTLHRLRDPEDNDGLDPTPGDHLIAMTELLSAAMKGH